VSLCVKEKRERSHKYLCTLKKKDHNKRKNKQNLFPCCSPKCSRNETRLLREKKKKKQKKRRLFIRKNNNNNNNKDRKKRKKQVYIYTAKKIIRKKNIRTWFILNPY